MIVPMKNPSAKLRPRGKPLFTRYVRAKGDPKGVPRDGPMVRSRGDP